MDFTNHQITNDLLPKIVDVEIIPLERKYLTAQKISLFITAFIFLTIAILIYLFIDNAASSHWFYISFTGIILVLLLLYVSNVISFKRKGYAIREKDVLYKSGWLVQKLRIVPLNRVQHVSVQSGPVERKFGLASVSLYTAGSDEADFSIKGLKEETAQQIKEWITSQLYVNNSNS